MKPKPVVQIQAWCALVASVTAIVLCGVPGANGVVVASGMGLAISLGLAIRYHRLARRRRRSGHRAQRDRVMGACMVIGFAVPVGIAVATLMGVSIIEPSPLGGIPARFAVIAAAAVFAAMLTSSCFDWYVIRPFRDGVLGPPACQMSEHDDETALFYAQALIAHRTVAEVIGWGATAIVLIVALVAIQHSTHNATWSGVFTYLAPSGAVYLGIGGYLVRRLRYVPQYVQRPSPGLGRWAIGIVPNDDGEERHIDGFVVDVALGVGLQVISEDGHRKNVDLCDTRLLETARRSLCQDRCDRLIPHCERGLLEDEEQRAGVPVVALGDRSEIAQGIDEPSAETPKASDGDACSEAPKASDGDARSGYPGTSVTALSETPRASSGSSAASRDRV